MQKIIGMVSPDYKKAYPSSGSISIWRYIVIVGIIVRIDTKIKMKNKDLLQICLIFKCPINKDLQKRVSVVS